MEMNGTDYNRLVNMAAGAGRIMLESGAETYRVEDTINRMLATAHLHNSSCWVVATAIIVSISDPQIETATAVYRVTTRTNNLNRVQEVNEISREFCGGQITLAEAEQALQRIVSEPGYGIGMRMLGYIGTSAFFCLLVGGGFLDSAAAAVCSTFSFLFGEMLGHFRFHAFFKYVFCSALSAVLAVSVSRFFPVHYNSVIIGCIMPLLPGLCFTNAIRDIFYGDYMAASGRMMEALFIAVSIAVGVGIGLMVLA